MRPSMAGCRSGPAPSAAHWSSSGATPSGRGHKSTTPPRRPVLVRAPQRHFRRGDGGVSAQGAGQ